MLNKNRSIIKNKQIVFKIPEFPHVSETFIIAQIVTAIKLGYDVLIIIRKLTETNVSVYSKIFEKYSLLDKIIMDDYKIPKNKIIRSFNWFILLLRNINHLNYIIKFHKEFPKFSLTWLYTWHFYQQFKQAAIIHIQYGTYKYPIDLLKKTGYFKPSVIATFHGHDAFFPLYGYIQNNGYYDNLFKYADVITANTPYLGNQLLKLGCPKEKLELVPVGVDADFFYPYTEKREISKTLRLITVGRLDKVKGHHFCIQSVYQLINKGIDVTLTIIGEGAEHSNLKSLITKYHLEDVVFMKGSKSQHEVRQALREHDVYLLTAASLPDGRRETQGLATLEAMACGLPVIGFDSGGIKYTFEDKVSGFICDEYDVDCVFNKIKYLIENQKILKEMGIKARKFVTQNYSQNIIDGKWDIIYRNLSNGK